MGWRSLWARFQAALIWGGSSWRTERLCYHSQRPQTLQGWADRDLQVQQGEMRSPEPGTEQLNTPEQAGMALQGRPWGLVLARSWPGSQRSRHLWISFFSTTTNLFVSKKVSLRRKSTLKGADGLSGVLNRCLVSRSPCGIMKGALSSHIKRKFTMLIRYHLGKKIIKTSVWLILNTSILGITPLNATKIILICSFQWENRIPRAHKKWSSFKILQTLVCRWGVVGRRHSF